MHEIARRTLVAAALAAAGSASGAGAAWGQPGDGRAAGSAAEPLRLGALFPLSGPLALLGDESFRGLELAAEERNAAGGLFNRPLRLLKADAPGGEAAVAEARRLCGEGRASAVFGTASSPLCFAASQVSEAAGVPFFELGAISDPITERGFRYLFRTCPRASDFARLAVDAVADLLAPALGMPMGTHAGAGPGALRVAVLHEDSLYGQTVAGFQEQRLRERGAPPVDRLGYAARGADMGALVQRLRGVGAAVVLHTGDSNDVVNFFRAQAEQNWRPLMVVGSGAAYSLSDTARAVGAGFENVLNVDFPQFALGEALAVGARAFAEAYQRKYGAEPRSGHSMANYHGARIAFDALARAGSADKDRLRAAVLATDLPDGTAPNGWGARFDERGQNTRARPLLHQWRDGRQVAVFPPAAAAAALLPRLD